MATAARQWFGRRPPRPPPVRRSVAPWEKDFCESHGVPWKKVTDRDAGLNADAEGRVALWDDSGAVQALLAAKKRYWAEINGGLTRRAVPPLPDRSMYIDEIVEDGVDPELDAEYEAALRAMEAAWLENLALQVARRRDDFVPVATGWDVDTSPSFDEDWDYFIDEPKTKRLRSLDKEEEDDEEEEEENENAEEDDGDNDNNEEDDDGGGGDYYYYYFFLIVADPK
ncbi:uncharacterized protein LOC133884048 [Phragmites australis]|uniref:uncharacterized protein LOC133884048 n=1 Tax=Phragmites australis TaxID=29695 RepID=UPI002D765853|nr:uncharacterized protein LOC133884048 [Phragmites australis]